MKAFLCCLYITLFCFSSMSFADIVDDAVKAIVSGEIENGHQVLLKEAYGGNAKAQHELGAYYEYYENDFEEAFNWYKKAADQGLAGAQYSVGSAYDLGQGVEQNSEKAIKWYQLSVEQNHVWAQYNLAICYLNGDGVPLDQQKAAQLMKKAAEQGHGDAQNNLASFYYKGQGIEQSPEKAIAWFIVAAISGSEPAQGNLDALKNFYNQETIVKGQQIAERILQNMK